MFLLRLQLLFYRFVSVNRWLRFFLYAAVLIIVILTNFLTQSQQKLSGIDFGIRLSYSYLASFVFYFLVVHLPKEERKQALYIIINNRTLDTLTIIRDYYRHILMINRKKIEDNFISLDEFVSLAHNINPMHPLALRIGVRSLKFNHHYECFGYISQIIQRNYSEITRFYDLLSPPFIYALNRANSYFQMPLLDGTVTDNKTLGTHAHGLYESLEFANTAWDLLRFSNPQSERIQRKIDYLKRKRIKENAAK
jgi:hypothetical protein